MPPISCIAKKTAFWREEHLIFLHSPAAYLTYAVKVAVSYNIILIFIISLGMQAGSEKTNAEYFKHVARTSKDTFKLYIKSRFYVPRVEGRTFIES